MPPPEIRRLRDLLRYRVSLLEQRNETHNKIRDLLETANIKLSSVVTDLLGVTGQRIMEALIAGETSTDRLSWKVKGRLRKKEKEVKQSLTGCFNEFHRGMLELLWKQYRFLSLQIEEVEARTRREMEPHRASIELLDTVPGVNEIIAWTVIAELGTDMSVFPTTAHVASWAGMCPGTHESAGKQISTRTTKGNRYLRRALLEAAWAATRKSSTARSPKSPVGLSPRKCDVHLSIALPRLSTLFPRRSFAPSCRASRTCSVNLIFPRAERKIWRSE